MRFLLDENVPRDAGVALREEGHDVVWASEPPLRGSTDDVLWRQAANDNRVFVTGDLDFPLAGTQPPALVLLRHFDRVSPRVLMSSLKDAVTSLGDDILGKLVVLSPGQMRVRGL
jgi:predicted nuclease of predicted toxin-antitoxin system